MSLHSYMTELTGDCLELLRTAQEDVDPDVGLTWEFEPELASSLSQRLQGVNHSARMSIFRQVREKRLTLDEMFAGKKLATEALLGVVREALSGSNQRHVGDRELLRALEREVAADIDELLPDVNDEDLELLEAALKLRAEQDWVSRDEIQLRAYGAVNTGAANRRLADLVKRGFLKSSRRGYRLTESGVRLLRETD